jgi:hypothetical protein
VIQAAQRCHHCEWPRDSAEEGFPVSRKYLKNGGRSIKSSLLGDKPLSSVGQASSPHMCFCIGDEKLVRSVVAKILTYIISTLRPAFQQNRLFTCKSPIRCLRASVSGLICRAAPCRCARPRKTVHKRSCGWPTTAEPGADETDFISSATVVRHGGSSSVLVSDRSGNPRACSELSDVMPSTYIRLLTLYHIMAQPLW